MREWERVKKAVNFEHPDHVPILMFNRDFDQSDIILTDVVRHFGGQQGNQSEFGFSWESHDQTMGQPKETIMEDLAILEEYTFPDPADPTRFADLEKAMETYKDKYHIAGLCLSGFTTMTLLHGLENTLMDVYDPDSGIEQLADRVFAFEEDIIRQCAARKARAIAFFDDWGTQNSLIVSPEKWREFFAPRYKSQFDLCHSLGMDVYFHCCGYIYEIIGDLIETGVDILNLSQPNIFDIPKLGAEFGGKVCFICPVSYQTTSLTGSRKDIFRDVEQLVTNFGSHGGGFIGYVEEYSSIGLSEENYQTIIEAFKTLGTY